MKENDLTLKKKLRSRHYPAGMSTDIDYTADQELQANTPAKAKPLLSSLEQAARSAGRNVNSDKTKLM